MQNIKIRNSHIYVNNQPYGTYTVVTNSKFNQLSQLVPPTIALTLILFHQQVQI